MSKLPYFLVASYVAYKLLAPSEALARPGGGDGPNTEVTASQQVPLSVYNRLLKAGKEFVTAAKQIKEVGRGSYSLGTRKVGGKKYQLVASADFDNAKNLVSLRYTNVADKRDTYKIGVEVWSDGTGAWVMDGPGGNVPRQIVSHATEVARSATKKIQGKNYFELFLEACNR